MSFLSKRSLIHRIRRNKESRTRLVSSNLDKGIAFQIRATRDAREMSQSELARVAGMTQNNVSRIENPEYGKQTISSLKRIADALDVALVVRLVPFSQYIDWISGTPYLDRGLRSESLAVPNFSDEEKSGKYETQITYYPVITQSIGVFGSVATAFTPQQQVSAVTESFGAQSQTSISTPSFRTERLAS